MTQCRLPYIEIVYQSCYSIHNRWRLRNLLGVDPQKSLKATLKRLSELNPESRAIVRIFSSEVTSIRWAC